MTKIECFKSFDGKLFESEPECEQYEYDYIAEKLEKVLLEQIVLSPKDKIRLFDNVFNNRKTINAVISNTL